MGYEHYYTGSINILNKNNANIEEIIENYQNTIDHGNYEYDSEYKCYYISYNHYIADFNTMKIIANDECGMGPKENYLQILVDFLIKQGFEFNTKKITYTSGSGERADIFINNNKVIIEYINVIDDDNAIENNI